LIQKKPFVVVQTLAGREVFRFLREEEEEEEDDGAAFRFVRSRERAVVPSSSQADFIATLFSLVLEVEEEECLLFRECVSE
jgi:hypothetical protein